MLKGNLDVVNHLQVSGWAQDDAQPDVPVSLLVTANDRLIGRILANRYRPDLEQAGIGTGRHSFELQFSKRLAPFQQHVVRVCRESDGADLAQSPVVLDATQAFDAAAQEALADAIRRCGSDQDIAAKIDFLVSHVEMLVQQLADGDSGRAERNRYRQLLQRWRRTPPSADAAKLPGAAAPRPHQRALVIDDRIPRSDRDAGSMAILSHMQSLQRLGYQVVFTPAADFAAAEQNSAALDAIGVTCCRAPYYGSIEEVLRRQAGEFDLVYMHRVSNALKYGELARYHNPRARRIYSVADLHHLRYARQASAEGRPELLALSQRVRFAEFVAAISADAVITHSTQEAEALAKQIPESKIHKVLWSTTPRPKRIPFNERRGVAFIGGYSHEPNLDAARWLISEIMPLVRKRSADIECLLVGSDMPEQLRRLCGDGVVAVGYVKDLTEIFDRVRLTVAPLTYGAGIKGKVIESLAAGLPCVCTPVAAEGLELPQALRAGVAESAENLAALICDLHDNEAANDACGRAGLDYVSGAFTDEKVDAAMRRVVGPAASLNAADKT
jgi:glycosyltransferase involved in cell wall biosynthesis